MSSKRNIRRHQCESKVRHATRAIADMALRHTGWKGPFSETRRGLSVYQCGNCGGFHVGHRVGVTTSTSAGLQKAAMRGHVRLRGVAA